jgi:flagellar basal body L-ring protein FlgH
VRAPISDGQSARAFARFQKKVLDDQQPQAQGDIVMVFVRQYSAAAERTTSCANATTLANRGRLFGGQHNDDPSKGSRKITVPMSQILEPVSRDSASLLGGLR